MAQLRHTNSRSTIGYYSICTIAFTKLLLVWTRTLITLEDAWLTCETGLCRNHMCFLQAV